MAVEIVGNPEDVKRYREYLHSQGTFTKRYQKEIELGLMEAKPDDYRTASFKIMVKEAPSEDSKADEPEDLIQIVGVANENAVDRMDERLEPAGVDIENFKKNPVLLIDHMYMTRAVVGAVTSVVPEDDGVKFTATLAKKTDEGLTEAQRETRILVKQGLVGTVSVGFIPQKVRAPEYDNEGRLLEPPVILQWELLEISIVAIPANAGSTFQMKDMARRIAFMDTSHESQAKSKPTLTERYQKEIIDQSKSKSNDLSEPQMDEIKELLAEMLGLIKSQVDETKALKELITLSKAEEEEEDEDMEEVSEMDEEEEEEEEKEKALEAIQQGVKANSEAIAKIAEVVTSLVNKG